ncbi:hypothetical protein [Paracoccus sp. JM45]|uniref:hypothetical protein n=1 Tax=Paracoccus sp. JM45 TaxID=2283626 RepID=UPI000E6CE84F|nr:hypothetical protein [Paracoccus sp. JM45]RJE80940.1 hypothetical protein DWB67_04920 [Paracoccus sp. JM45]
MTQKLFIHIGTHKTATTWLQHFLGMNADRLEDMGYYYPKTGRVNHAQHRIGQAIFQRPKSAAPIHDIPLWQRFKREIGSTRYENIVISSEEFEWVHHPKVIRDFLPDVEIHVVCYLRRQDDYFESLYGQQIRDFKPRLTVTIEEQLRKPHPYLDYKALIERWSGAADQTHVRVFDRKFMVNGDIGQDFLSCIGLPGAEGFVQPTGAMIDHKASLSLSALEFVRHCNTLNFSEPYHNRLVNQVIRLDKLYKAVNGHKQRLLSTEQRQSLLAVYENGNKAIAKQYPHVTGLSGLFAPIKNDAVKFTQTHPQSEFELLIRANGLVPIK